jgi:hypothetical protein
VGISRYVRMKRLAPLALILLLLLPVAAESTGTLTIPVTFGSLTAGVQNLPLFDTAFSAIAAYINAREITQGTAANRPAAGVQGRYYFSTDLNGGTLYGDTGSAWTQLAAPVTGSLAEQFTGLTLSNNATNPGSTIAIAVGAATSDDAVITSRVLMSLTSAFTKTTAAFTAGTGNGCLDTGTVAASTWYSVFLIQRIDTGGVDVLCSTSATAPTMPTNFTKKRRLGSILTDASSAINFFTQRGVFFFTWATPTALNVNTINGGTAAITATATTPNGVATRASLHACVVSGTAANAIYISALTEADVAPSQTASPLSSNSTIATGGANGQCEQVDVWTDTARQFRFRQSANGANQGLLAVTIGWYDALRP